MGRVNKRDIIRNVQQCVIQYDKNLCNQNLLFISIDKHKHLCAFECSFFARNFLHLTGLRFHDTETSSNAKHFTEATNAEFFYRKCLEQRLGEDDIEVPSGGLAELKLQVLPYLLKENLSATMVGDYNSYNPRLYTEKLAGNLYATMGFTTDVTTNRLVPNTVLKRDITSVATPYSRVIGVCRKPIHETLYNEVTYCAKQIPWEHIVVPSDFKYQYVLTLLHRI